MKRILTICMSLVLMTFSFCSLSSFTTQNSLTYRSADSSGAYVVDFSGKHAQIIRYGSRNYSASLNVSYTISAVCAYQGKIVLFCDDTNNNQLIVYVYYLDSDLLDSFAIYGAKLYGSTDFACDDRAIYIESHRDSHEVKAYSYNGSLNNTYRFDGEVTSLFSGYQSGVHAVAADRLYTLSGKGFTSVSGDSIETPLFPANNHILASVYGSVYVLDDDRITDTFTVDTDFEAGSACVIGDRLYYPDGRTIYGYDIETGEKICYYKTADDIRLLYADGNNVIAVGRTSSVSIHKNDFTEPRTSDESPDKEYSNPAVKTPSSGRGTSGGTVSGISSDVYGIDFEQYRITGISPDTTIAGFKSNIRYDGYTLTVYRDNDVKKSGNVGTAMTAVFTSSDSNLTFELAVDGDLTGEGSRNSRDLNLLMDYLIGAADFNGVYAIAANLSGDQTIDVVDLALLKSQI